MAKKIEFVVVDDHTIRGNASLSPNDARKNGWDGEDFILTATYPYNVRQLGKSGQAAIFQQSILDWQKARRPDTPAELSAMPREQNWPPSLEEQMDEIVTGRTVKELEAMAALIAKKLGK